MLIIQTLNVIAILYALRGRLTRGRCRLTKGRVGLE